MYNRGQKREIKTIWNKSHKKYSYLQRKRRRRRRPNGNPKTRAVKRSTLMKEVLHRTSMLRETCYEVSIHSVWRRKKGVALLLSAPCDVECAKRWGGGISSLVISHAPLEKNGKSALNSWLFQGLGPLLSTRYQ